MRRVLTLLLAVLVLVWTSVADAGTITRPSKSFGGTSFITGVVPTAADFNGDHDTVYSEVNGSLSNVNISASAAIAGSKISPAFTLDTSVTTATPCRLWIESDEAADAQRWYACVSGGVWQLHTRTDAGVVQATPIQINRSTGVVTFVDAMIATQAQMEAATSLVTIVTPGRTQYHPGVAKGFVNAETTGSPGLSYNVSSVTDSGVGVITVNWTTAFSGGNASYVVQVTAQTAETLIHNLTISNGTTPTTTATIIVCYDAAGTPIDPVRWHVVAHGDQ